MKLLKDHRFEVFLFRQWTGKEIRWYFILAHFNLPYPRRITTTLGVTNKTKMEQVKSKSSSASARWCPRFTIGIHIFALAGKYTCRHFTVFVPWYIRVFLSGRIICAWPTDFPHGNMISIRPSFVTAACVRRWSDGRMDEFHGTRVTSTVFEYSRKSWITFLKVL